MGRNVTRWDKSGLDGKSCYELLRLARLLRAARVVRVLFTFRWQEKPRAYTFHAESAQSLLHGKTGPDNAA